ncbi:hypothetical protein P7C73_g2426, partial [Tremellales sp. Uapishka_1]
MARKKTGGVLGKRDKAEGKRETAGGVGGAAAPDASSLIDKAHTLLAQSNFELAIKFLERALALDPADLEARELVGVAELEGGDAELGREHLLKLLPPHTTEPPAHPSPYLYLAQTAATPQEALGYYSTATAMIEQKFAKGKGREEVQDDEEKKMAVTALVAMIEIWMTDLCFEENAEANCDSLIGRALSISPMNPEARISLASIRMSQSRFQEAKDAVMSLYEEIQGKEPFDESLPPLPARLLLTRLLLEHSLHLQALDILSTVREEDSLQVEGAYLEGWALYLRAEHLAENPETKVDQDNDNNEEMMTMEECYSEAMSSLLECANYYTEQEYEDEGIGNHVKELLELLEAKGIKPVAVEEEEEEEGEGEGGEGGADWEDLDEEGDVEMA